MYTAVRFQQSSSNGKTRLLSTQLLSLDCLNLQYFTQFTCSHHSLKAIYINLIFSYMATMSKPSHGSTNQIAQHPGQVAS